METSQISRQDRILLIIVGIIVIWFLLVGMWLIIVSTIQNVSLFQTEVSRRMGIAGLAVFFIFLIVVRWLSKKRNINTIQVENNEVIFLEGSLLDKKKIKIPLSEVKKIEYIKKTEMIMGTSVSAALKKYIHFNLSNGTKETMAVSFYQESTITNFLDVMKKTHPEVQVLEDTSGIWKQ